jgi:microcystin degradation protein MlrC
MRFYYASLSHETSRFSPIPTDLDSYRESCLYLPSTGEGAKWLSEVVDEVRWSAILKERGHEVVIGPLAFAQPSRPTSRGAYETLRHELASSLREAGPIDGVMLFLHGAQVAEGTDDCEGDFLTIVRDIVGPDVPVGFSFDLHGNISKAMVEKADIALGCLEYPHIDFDERAIQVSDLVERAARREIRPVMAHRRVPMLGTYYTTQSPMREFVDWAKSFEGRDGILGVSIMHGFAWADIADCGGGILVCADGNLAQANALADQIAERYFELRDAIRAPRIGVEEIVKQALAHEGRPVIIADTTDNPGGGAAGDSTFLLRALIDAKVDDVVVGMLWDPIAVKIAHRAGEGAHLSMRIGGKTGPGSGAPLDVEAEILRCSTDAWQWAQGSKAPLGPAALIRTGGVRIVLNSVRQQVFDPACFEAFGVDLRTCRIVIVKSQQHFRAMFAEFASQILYATPPGTVNMDYRAIPFSNIPRPMYPIDMPPFRAFGRDWRA